MKFDLTHPVYAEGIHRQSGAPKTFVGTVSTPIEVAELSAGDVEPAFTIPSERCEVVRHDGKLYRSAPHGIGALSRMPPSQASLVVEDTAYHMQSPYETFAKWIGGVEPQDKPRLFPQPRGHHKTGVELGTVENVMVWTEKLGPIADRSIMSLRDDQVEIWRAEFRDFYSNFMIVGGRLMARCHEPILSVSPHGVHVSDFSNYRASVDHDRYNTLGFKSGIATWWTDTHPFPADMYSEAHDFAGLSGIDVRTKSDPIIVHGDCISLHDLLDEELIRIANLNFILGEIVAQAMEDVPPVLTSSLDKLRLTARSYRDGNVTNDDLAEVVGEVADLWHAIPVLSERIQKALAVASNTRVLLKRRDDAPISVPGLKLG